LPNAYEIALGDVTNVANAEREQSACAPRSGYEFDFKAVRFVDFNDRTEIADLEAVLREVTIENDGI